MTILYIIYYTGNPLSALLLFLDPFSVTNPSKVLNMAPSSSGHPSNNPSGSSGTGYSNTGDNQASNRPRMRWGPAPETESRRVQERKPKIERELDSDPRLTSKIDEASPNQYLPGTEFADRMAKEDFRNEGKSDQCTQEILHLDARLDSLQQTDPNRKIGDGYSSSQSKSLSLLAKEALNKSGKPPLTEDQISEMRISELKQHIGDAIDATEERRGEAFQVMSSHSGTIKKEGLVAEYHKSKANLKKY